MENDPLPYVKASNTLLIKIKQDKIIGILVLKLRAIQNLESMKDNNLELLKYALLIVENLLNNKTYNTIKKRIRYFVKKTK